MLRDLLDFAATHLVLGGRLVFWLPSSEDAPIQIPERQGMSLLAVSEQDFGNWSRKLVTMRKDESFAAGAKATIEYCGRNLRRELFNKKRP